MARYIDADLLIKNIVSIEDLRTLSTKTIGEAIDKTPTADVAEVKHGEWIYTGSCQVCSICDEEQYGVDTGRFYCPNCGAKMDGGDSK